MLIWPSRVLVPANALFDFMFENTSGGISFSSAEVVIGNSPGRGRIDLTNVEIYTPQQVMEWLTLAAALGGRYGQIMVPVWERPRAPFPTRAGALVTTWGNIPNSDGSLFSDGSGYHQPVIVATTMVDTPQAATQTQIEVQYGGPLLPSQVFGDGAGKVYRITNIVNVDSSGPYPVYTVNFKLQCRNDIPVGTLLDFDNPKLLCQLETDDGMRIKNGLTFWRRASPSVSFLEVVG